MNSPLLQELFAKDPDKAAQRLVHVPMGRFAETGEIAALSQADINQEVRLVTAVLDGIRLQWLLDPSTDVVASVTAYITHSITRWRSGMQSPQ